MAGSTSGPKRTPFQREKDLVEIARCYLHGMSQMEIGEMLGVSQSQISRDLKVLRERWQKSALLDINEAKAQELARIDNLEREYWEAWRVSCGERIDTETEQIAGAGANGDRKRVKVKKVKLAGDPDYLAGIQWCIEMRCKILGIYQPGRAANPLGMIDYSKLSDAQLERIAAGEDPLKVLISGNSSGISPGAS